MSGNHGYSGRSRWLTTMLVVAAMLVAFAAGLGASYVLKGSGNLATPNPSSTSQPCVTKTALVGAGLPNPSQVQLNVYNAAHIAGLARRTGADLAADGFIILSKTNDPLGKTLETVGEIRYGPTGAKGATLLLAYAIGAKLVNDGRSDASVDFAVGKGYVGLATAAQVLTTLAKPITVVTGAGCTS
ncbi:MAG: LytR C-terminal domain-containing protein [Actinomycetes bacterium]